MGKFKKIDWLNHFLEFIVVIIGILIAFQLNTCSIDNKQSKLLESHMKNIIEETQFNKQNVNLSIESSNQLLKDIDSLFIYINNEGSIDSINNLTFEILSIGNTYYKQNAYNSLVESGDIRFFKDFETKDDIIRLYEYYTWSQAIEKVTLDYYTNYYYPYVMDNFDLYSAKAQDRELYSNKKFKNVLATYKYMMVSKRNKQKETLGVITDFLNNYN